MKGRREGEVVRWPAISSNPWQKQGVRGPTARRQLLLAQAQAQAAPQTAHGHVLQLPYEVRPRPLPPIATSSPVSQPASHGHTAAV